MRQPAKGCVPLQDRQDLHRLASSWTAVAGRKPSGGAKEHGGFAIPVHYRRCEALMYRDEAFHHSIVVEVRGGVISSDAGGAVARHAVGAKPGARPYCSAQPQRVSMPPFAEWAPAGLLEKHAPKLPEAFWKKYGLSGNSKACGVVGRPNEPVKMGDW
jgi:hypothetical protein